MRKLTKAEIERADDWINAHEIGALGGTLQLDQKKRAVVAIAPQSLPVESLIRIGLCMTSLSSEGFVVMPSVETSARQIVLRLDLAAADQLARQLTRA